MSTQIPQAPTDNEPMSLTDDEIETVWPASTTASVAQDDADGADADGTDSGDGDAADSGDGDAADSGDGDAADASDGADADGTDA
ncbi:MAG: hypothetical protein WD080_03830 [Egibacteraceae bacterium]